MLPEHLSLFVCSYSRLPYFLIVKRNLFRPALRHRSKKHAIHKKAEPNKRFSFFTFNILFIFYIESALNSSTKGPAPKKHPSYCFSLYALLPLLLCCFLDLFASELSACCIYICSVFLAYNAVQAFFLQRIIKCHNRFRRAPLILAVFINWIVRN